MNVKIYKASVEQASIIAPLFDAYRVFYEQDPDPDGALHFIKERLEKNESAIFVADDDGKGVGFVQLYPIFSSVGMRRAWLLNDLYTSATSRGKGVATALLEAAKDFARSQNSKWLMLQTHAENYSAQALYAKNGWRRETDLFYVFDL